MALPKAAQQQLKAAEKLHAEAYPDGDAKTPETTTGGDTTSTELREVPKETPADDTEGEKPGEPVQSEAPVETPTEAPAEDDWEHKYKVLQGKYNAEVPRLQQANDALNGRVAEMEAQTSQKGRRKNL